MGSSGEALSEARLAAIREHLEAQDRLHRMSAGSYPPVTHERALLAEVERLRAALAAAAAREAALVAVVRQIVRPPEGVELLPVYVRPEAYRQARALLASADEQGEA